MVTLILGGQASGKTTLAKKMTQDKKTVWLDRSDVWREFGLKDITIRTKCIIIEEVSDTDVIYFYNAVSYLPIHRPMKKSVIIDLSKREIIITSNTIKKKDLNLSKLGNVKIIELQKEQSNQPEQYNFKNEIL